MRHIVALSFGLVVVLAAPAARPAPTFVGLGALPGTTTSLATGVSADGSVVVGLSGSSDERAFRWTAAGGMVDLGGLPGDSESRALGVSADGSVIVGASENSPDYSSQAVRWTGNEGAVGLGFLPTDPGGCCGFYSNANAVSADGSVVAETAVRART